MDETQPHIYTIVVLTRNREVEEMDIGAHEYTAPKTVFADKKIMYAERLLLKDV